MPNDMRPTRGYSFKDFSKAKPSTPLPGDRLDVELNKIYKALSENAKLLTSVVNPAGGLIGPLVGESNLKPGFLDFIIKSHEEKLAAWADKAQTHEASALNPSHQSPELC